MIDFFKLYNQIKHYEWGSPELIPEFIGSKNENGQPWAEMWMGIHPGAPSMVKVDGNKVSLRNLIAENPDCPTGELPFLFKLLAAGKPLSIQAHPNKVQAEEGFERENKTGLTLDNPRRNYKDPNHKPEILCALTPFTAMCGFRKPDEIRCLIEDMFKPDPSLLKTVFSPLLTALYEAQPLRKFLHALFTLTSSQSNELCTFILETMQSAETEPWNLIRDFALSYPGDPAILSPLYLNLFTLEPGQAIFVPAGILHAYIKGLGVELMSNSDNVLRGGLTPKYIDTSELMNILNFNSFKPQILNPPSSLSSFRYPAPCRDFSLSLICSNGGKINFKEKGPSVCIVINGDLQINGTTFKKGESFFISCRGNDRPPLIFEGNFSLYAAVPSLT